jgi:Raf kinase inhibitor-like YbhB/YbcL family protein
MRRLLVVALLVVSCSPADETSEESTSSTVASATPSTTAQPETTPSTTPPPAFGVTSPAFETGAPIPAEYTCDGEDVSPELGVVGIPDEAQSLAVIVNDPDAPTGVWNHWVEFNIPIRANSMTIARATDPIGVQGANSWNLGGYMGPCPPPGETHNYLFTIYALDSTLDLPEGVPATQVEAAIEGHIIDSVELTGTYGR